MADQLPKLDGNQDWGLWMEAVQDHAKKLDIWKYIDPEGEETLEPPGKPELPTATLPKVPVRRQGKRATGQEELPVRPETDQEFQQRLQHYNLQCERLERQHRLDIMSYQCKETRYREDMKQYERVQYLIRELYMYIEQSGRGRYGSLSVKSDPRQQLGYLVCLGRGSVEDRFWGLIRQQDIEHWEQWAIEVERGFLHARSFGLMPLYEWAAVLGFMQAVRSFNPEFHRTWSARLNIDKDRGKEADFLSVMTCFRGIGFNRDVQE